MLVLTRKLEESLLLGSEIRITVLGINGDKVRLGIDAPRTVKILRGETVDQTRDANRLSASSGMNLAAIFKDAAQAVAIPKPQAIGAEAPRVEAPRVEAQEQEKQD